MHFTPWLRQNTAAPLPSETVSQSANWRVKNCYCAGLPVSCEYWPKKGSQPPWSYCEAVVRGVSAAQEGVQASPAVSDAAAAGRRWGPSAHLLLSSEAASSNAALQRQNRWHTLLAAIQRCHLGLRNFRWKKDREVVTENAGQKERKFRLRLLRTVAWQLHCNHMHRLTVWQMGVWLGLDTVYLANKKKKCFKIIQVLKDSNGVFALVNRELTMKNNFYIIY